MIFDKNKFFNSNIFSSKPEQNDPFTLNNDGYRLVNEGKIDEGMRLLSLSAEAGLPWALATYTWQRLREGNLEDTVSFYYKVKEALELELRDRRHFPEWVYQVANAKSNVALALVLLNRDVETALSWWKEGAKLGHSESILYPAVYEFRNGNRDDAVQMLVGKLTDDFDGDKTLEELSTENFHKLREWAESGLELLKLVESESASIDHSGKKRGMDKSHAITRTFAIMDETPSDSIATPFENRCKILGEFWLTNKNEEEVQGFISVNDIGLPLAFLLSEGLVSVARPDAEQFVNDTWRNFCTVLNLSDGIAYEDLQSIAASFEED